MKSVRLSRESEEKLRDAAQAEGLTESEFIRQAVDERIQRVPHNHGDPPRESRFSGRLAGLDELIGTVDYAGGGSLKRIGDQMGSYLRGQWDEQKRERRRRKRG